MTAVQGLQLHHSTLLGDAYRGAVNATAGLRAAAGKTGDPAHQTLHDEACALARRIGEAETAARDALAQIHADNPAAFRQARDGVTPWPDENGDGFEPRCFCHDQCLYHDHGVLDAITQCTCGSVCPAHPENRVALHDEPEGGAS